jgi:general nucleoside transport system permease protein
MTENQQADTQFVTFLKKNGILIVLAAIMLALLFWSYSNNAVKTVAVLASALRHSTPLVLGALCGLIGERSGIINIGIEGQMLMAAFLSFLTSSFTNSIGAGIAVGLLTGALLGLLLAFMSVTLKVDQIIGGTVINILALGITGYFYQSGLTTSGKLSPIPIPVLSDLPIVGRVLFNNPPITYVTIILVFVVHYALFHTKWGLRTRAVGEHPRAADTVGVNVFRLRYINVMLAGAIGGLAGAFLTLEAVGSFERAMTNGRGFVALAVMLFGKYTPFGAWGAALLFGLATAMQTQLQFAGTIDIPHQFIGMIPYIMTILVLAGFVGRTRVPAAGGKVYEKEG